MKSKKDGFVSIECILSLSIVSVAMYVISTTLLNSYEMISSHKYKLEMLNIAKSNIKEIKYRIKNNINYEKYETETINEYEINTLIEENKYYNCSKISVEVKRNMDIINISTYAFEQ